MKRITVVLIALCFVLMASNTFAYGWVFNGDSNGVSPETASGLQMGVANFGSPESGVPQPIQISGAGTTLSGYSNLLVSFYSNFSTWDIYKPGGYYDVFAAVLSENNYYWNLDTSIHPLENNPALILGYDGFGPSYWGGQLADNDGILETDSGFVAFNFSGLNPAKEYYLSVFLQTRSDVEVPSWGTISNLYAGQNAVPEPASLSLLGLGLLGLIKSRLRKKK